ncbi:hypothetical protein K504DRAFT_468499 [Pleomassaria siparia CBS 279.74]|uniref:Structure-specific endonuclease subunit SLX4 n=1 Tax=Pleomassaria siparia CBS 279.74 TaxID=1314801 RepID=A0A6G1K5H5_9PLEO|nr:hypothetical protein K504DRAFT_468499 [Pleomassaria siparia CBS 279.74]
MAGITFDLLVLSSSPPPSSAPSITTPPSNQQRVRMATPLPAALSPLASPKRKTSGALRSDSRAVPLPKSASRGFATAASLTKSHHFGGQNDVATADIPQLQSRRNSLHASEIGENAPKEPRNRATKAGPATDEVEQKPKKPRARKPKADKEVHMHDAVSRNPPPTTSSHFGNPPTIEHSGETPIPNAKAKLAKPRKPRAKKEKPENGETQTKIPKARITKPRGVTISTAKVARKAKDDISSHSATGKIIDVTRTRTVDPDVGAQPITTDDVLISDVARSHSRKRDTLSKQKAAEQALELDEAVSRRMDWTPTKDTSAQNILTDSAGKENTAATLHVESGAFTHLLSSFAFANPNSQSTTNTTMANLAKSGSSGVMKRRRVELVDVPGNQSNSRNVSPEKSKAPKKKPRTITDFVTDQYAPPKESVPQPSVATGYFEPRPTTTTTTTKVPLNDASDKPTKPPRKRPSSKSASESGETKARSKPKKPSTKTIAKPKLVADKLLSPASAVMKMNKQDILFGTSSQLALEESPTQIRHLQQALHESEIDAEILLGISSAPGTMAPPVWPRLGKVKGKRGLWSASTRGEDGQLLEKTEDVYLPDPDRTQDLPLLMDVDGSHSDDDIDTGFVGIDHFQSNQGVIHISSDSVLPMDDGVFDDVIVRVRDEREMDFNFNKFDDNEPVPPPSNQKAESSFFDIDDFLPQSHVPSPVASNSSSFLNIDEISPPAHYSGPSLNPTPSTSITTGSPKNRRSRSPKTHPAISSNPKSITTKQPASKGTSKARQPSEAPPSTPPRSSKGRFADIEEILDSEDDEALSPSPPRISRLHATTLSLEPSIPSLLPPSKPTNMTDEVESDDLDTVRVLQMPRTMIDWATSKSYIFTQITAAIRALPPTIDLKSPSWHERILLYDAIVLEDFTAFLNTSTRIRTYKKATQKQTKAWNKKLKKEGRDALPDVVKGDDGAVNVVEKELEDWMVQGWCESMSVCAINKVRGRRSGMGKGLC